MSLFAVSGWNAPTKLATSDATMSRKRKRAAVAEEDSKVQAATINIEKLMKKLDTGDSRTPNVEQKKKEKPRVQNKASPGRNPPKAGKNIVQSEPPILSSPVKESKKKQKRMQKDSRALTEASQEEMPGLKQEPTKGLTALQSSMKSSLEGARFR